MRPRSQIQPAGQMRALVAVGRGNPPRVPPALVVVLRRTPLTLATIAAVTGVAAWSGALGGKTPWPTVERWGFDLQNLAHGRAYTLATMHLLVFDRTHCIVMVSLLALFMGPLEAGAGTRAAAEVFWISAVAGALVAAVCVALPAYELGWRPHPDLIRQADVGASIGVVGSLGALLVLAEARFGRWIWLPRAVALTYLAGALWHYRAVADVEHVAGFAIGSLVALRLGLRRPRPSP